MGSRQFLLEMKVVDGAPPPAFATAVPAMFEALIDVFAPLEVAIHVDGEQQHLERIDPVRVFDTRPLWCDEELTRHALTRCPPALGTDVIAELHDRLAGVAPAAFDIRAEGAVLHRAFGTDAPAWYGRFLGAGLGDLATISFRWTASRRAFELACPLAGYPFTPKRLHSSGLVSDGDPAVAADNRALWLPHLCKVRAALGFDREEVEWGTTGDATMTDVRKHWLPPLRAS